MSKAGVPAPGAAYRAALIGIPILLGIGLSVVSLVLTFNIARYW